MGKRFEYIYDVKKRYYDTHGGEPEGHDYDYDEKMEKYIKELGAEGWELFVSEAVEGTSRLMAKREL